MLNSPDVNNPKCVVRVKNGVLISIKCFKLQEEVITFFLLLPCCEVNIEHLPYQILTVNIVIYILIDLL